MVRIIRVVAIRVTNDSVCRAICAKLMAALGHIRHISKAAPSSFCDAVEVFLLHGVESLFASDSLPVALGTSKRPVLVKSSNFTSQSSIGDWSTACVFVSFPMNRNFDLFIDILGRTNSASMVEGGNRGTSLRSIGNVSLWGSRDGLF